MAKIELGGFAPFDASSDPTSICQKWKRWLRGFQLYADGKGLILTDGEDDNKIQRRALLLHSAGPEVQDIFEVLPDTGGPKDYEMAEKALNDYFMTQVNIPFERHQFREMRQGEDETVDQYVVRLKRKAESCDYGDQADSQIRDQIISTCRSQELRRKLLEKGQKLTLKELQDKARTFEVVRRQSKSMSGQEANVNRISGKTVQHKKKEKADQSGKSKEEKTEQKSTKATCYRCGRQGHFARNPNCPARNKTCNKCKQVGHFASVCKTKKVQLNEKGKINHVETDDEYAFSVDSKNDFGKVQVTVGGQIIKMIIDSGASVNIIDRKLWEKLKEKRIKCRSRKSNKKLFSYGSTKPLNVLGSFTTTTSVGEHSTEAEFVVIGGRGEPLLGRSTAMKLGILKIGPSVMNVSDKPQIMDNYKEVFQGVGKLKDYQLKLHIDPNVTPVAQPARRIPFSLRDKVKDKINELIGMDIIEPVEGPTPWVSPVVVVPKVNGDIRLCVDMRCANEAIIRERHPIPTVDEVLQSLNQSTVFSKLDLKWGYHQVELDQESRSITTFVTHCGLYRYKRLMFGINAAPEIYQHVIQQALQNCGNAANISDDIIVHAKTEEQHDRILEKVLKTLKEKNLTLNEEKCKFHMTQLEFMGFVLSKNGIGPTEEKVKAVANAREPKNASEVKSFLGLVNYNARFIPDFATITEPLRKLTKSDTPFEFGEEQRQAFNKLKTKLSEAKSLAYFDKDAKTRVITDASPVGLGAVLTQEKNGEYRVVSYASRSLTDVEKRYSQTEKEALAIVWACERFHVYLYGIDFELCTDHKPLEIIYSPKSKPCARIERWVLRLQPYRFTVRHIPGKRNVADVLSRLTQIEPNAIPSEQKIAEEYVRFVALTATPKALTTREVEEASDKDEELCKLREVLNTGKWHNDECKEYIPASGELCVVGKLILRGTRMVIPRNMRAQVLTLAHEGHPGIVSMKQRLRTKVWWPGITNDVEKYCKTCHGCQLVSQPSRPEPIRSTEVPNGPWQDLALDFLGPLPSGHYILAVIDYYSRYYEVCIMKTTTADKVIESLDEMFSRHGLPLSIASDNGPQFVSRVFSEYLENNGIKHRRVTPLWPQANGEIERQNRSMLKRMQIAQAEGKDWQKELRTYLTAYRTTPHTTTGVSPAELLFRRKIRTRLPDVAESARDDEFRDKDVEMKMKAKLYADKRRNAEIIELVPGDEVLLKQNKENKLSTRFEPVPYQVVGKENNSVVVESPQGAQYRRNITHVKKYQTPPNLPPNKPEGSDQTIGSATETPHKEGAIKPSPVKESLAVTRPTRVRSAPKRFDDFVLS